MPYADRPYRLLLIDDNQGDLGLFQEALTVATVPIVLVTRENAQQALDLLATDHHFDLILSDLNMPRVSGVELVNRLAETPALQHIPIALMSSSHVDKLPASLAGAFTVPYFTKAATWSEFVHLVHSIEVLLSAGSSQQSARLLAERMTPARGFTAFPAE